MQYKDYYKTLDITKTANEEEIKKAYRTLVKKHHPDKNQGDKKSEDKFKEVSEAYEVLSDVEKRKKYDNFENQTHFSGRYDFDPNKYGFSSDNVRYEYSDGNGDRSDFFNSFFSGADFDLGDVFFSFGSSSSRQQRIYDGNDIESEIEITPEEGHNGVEKRIVLQTENGVKNITFKIPKGVDEGERIRLKNQGSAGANGGKSGNLHMKVKFVPGNLYIKKGNDIYSTISLYPWEAALGTKRKVKTLDGFINVTIPKETQTDKKIRITGKGYSSKNRNQGDLYLEIKIVNPSRITPKMKELYQELNKAVS